MDNNNKPFDIDLLHEHRDFMKQYIPETIYLGLNIVSYYSMINELELYFRSFESIFKKVIIGISPEEFMNDVFPWIQHNCPLRDIYAWDDKPEKILRGDVIFYEREDGILDGYTMQIIVTDVENQMGINYLCTNEKSYKDLKKIAVVSPRDYTYVQTSETDLTHFLKWEKEYKKEWFK